MNQIQTLIFRLFERRRLRDWFYTVAFVIFVPVGLRFAVLAWRYGSWVDKPLAVIAGLFIGVTTVVTLVRFWRVPPQQVVTPAAPEPEPAPKPARAPADEFLAAVKRRSAQNRALASGAASLGSTLHRYR
jgi:hypothetical protein